MGTLKPNLDLESQNPEADSKQNSQRIHDRLHNQLFVEGLKSEAATSTPPHIPTQTLSIAYFTPDTKARRAFKPFLKQQTSDNPYRLAFVASSNILHKAAQKIVSEYRHQRQGQELQTATKFFQKYPELNAAWNNFCSLPQDRQIRCLNGSDPLPDNLRKVDPTLLQLRYGNALDSRHFDEKQSEHRHQRQKQELQTATEFFQKHPELNAAWNNFCSLPQDRQIRCLNGSDPLPDDLRKIDPALLQARFTNALDPMHFDACPEEVDPLFKQRRNAIKGEYPSCLVKKPETAGQAR